MIIYPLETTKEDDHRLTIRVGALLPCEDCSQHRLALYCLYHSIRLLREGQYDQYDKLLTYSYTSSISFFASLVDLVSAVQCKSHQKPVSVLCAYANERGLSFALVGSYNSFSYVQAIAPYESHDIFSYSQDAGLYASYNTSYDNHVFFLYNASFCVHKSALCFSLDTVFYSLLLALYVSLHIVSDKQSSALYCSDNIASSLLRAVLCFLHNTLRDIPVNAPYGILHIASFSHASVLYATLHMLCFSRLSLPCGLDNVASCILSCMFCRSFEDHLHGSCFWKSVQELQDAIAVLQGIWDTVLTWGDCSHEQRVIGYSRRNLLTGLAHVPGCFCIDVISVGTTLLGHNNILPQVYHKTARRASLRAFWHVKKHKGGVIRDNIQRSGPSIKVVHPVNLCRFQVVKAA